MCFIKAFANGAADYTGRAATIETNHGGSGGPWVIVLDDGRPLCTCGSYATAWAEFQRRGLRIG